MEPRLRRHWRGGARGCAGLGDGAGRVGLWSSGPGELTSRAYRQYASVLQLLPESALQRIAKRSTDATMSSVSQEEFQFTVRE